MCQSHASATCDHEQKSDEKWSLYEVCANQQCNNAHQQLSDITLQGLFRQSVGRSNNSYRTPDRAVSEGGRLELLLERV